MKKYLTYLNVTILSLFCQQASSQHLTTYNGSFDSPYETGQAKYNYYEDPNSYERIKQGAFQYSSVQKGIFPGSSLQKKFSGNFKNGLKDGLWTYSIIYSDYVYSISVDYKYYATGSINLKITYKDGYPSGACTYTCQLKERDISTVLGQIRYGSYKELKHVSINLNYINGTLSGPVSLSYYLNDIDFNLKRDEASLKGQLDSEGNLTGSWRMVLVDQELGGAGKVEINAEYKKGWQLKNISRKFLTGEVFKTAILNDKEKQIVDQQIAGKIKTSDDLKSLGYKEANGNLFDEFPIVFNSIYDDTDFLYSTIKGDSEMKDGKFESDGPNGGYYSLLQVIE